MASKKKQKYPSTAKARREARASREFKVKTGEYDGSTSSDDFVVSGHSSGSPNSEMEALSVQVARDAGRVPDVPLEYTSDTGDTGYDEYQGEGLGDLGGPELYGDHPSLLAKSPIHFANARRLTLGTAVAAMAGSAALAGVAYVLFRNLRSSNESRSARTPRVLRQTRSHKNARKASHRSAPRKNARRTQASSPRAH